MEFIISPFASVTSGPISSIIQTVLKLKQFEMSLVLFLIVISYDAIFQFYKRKGNVVPVSLPKHDVMKAHRGFGGNAPLILILHSSWR
jgi:hypothetical protein